MDLDTIFSRLRPTAQFGYYKQRRRQPTIQKTGGLFKGDALQVMRQFPSAQFWIIVTSPPYNLRNSSGHGLRDGRGGKWHNAALLQGYDQHADCMSHDDYVAWQRLYLAEMMRLLRQDGAISGCACRTLYQRRCQRAGARPVYRQWHHRYCRRKTETAMGWHRTIGKLCQFGGTAHWQNA